MSTTDTPIVRTYADMLAEAPTPASQMPIPAGLFRDLLASINVTRTALINVKDYNAKGDGVTDDTAAITAADLAAALVSGKVLFPASALPYMANNLSPTASWIGYGATIKNNNAANPTVKPNGKTGLVFDGLTFDGNVSADPGGGWTSGNYDSFTGNKAFYALNCTRLSLVSCIFQNSRMSPCRIETCTDVKVLRCRSTKGRGNFGDAFYTYNSRNVRFLQCDAEDYTRIGFVTEGDSADISRVQCRAYNGHDASVLYGGTEFNAGFWDENTADVSYDSCVADTNTHRGFSCTTGTVTGKTRALYNLVNCTSYMAAPATGVTTIGFVLTSKTGLPAEHSAVNCRSFGAIQGFNSIAVNDSDVFNHISCHSDVLFTAGANDIAFFWGSSSALTNKPTFRYRDCTVQHNSEDLTDLGSTASNSADVSCSTGGKAVIIIQSMRNIDSSKPIYLKQRTGASDADYTIRDTRLNIVTGVQMGICRFFNCDIDNADNLVSSGAAMDVSLIDCQVNGSFKCFTTGRFRMRGGRINPGTAYLMVNRTLSDKDVWVEFDGVRIEKDINTNDYAVRIQEEGANKPNTIFRNCTFYEINGTLIATKPFVWAVRAATPVAFAGCYYDYNAGVSGVQFVLMVVAALSTPAGNTALTLH